MYGDRAVQLLRELKHGNTLPPFNDEAYRNVLQEMEILYKEVSDNVQNELLDKDDAYAASNLIVHHYSFLRDKRCMLVYLHERLARLKRLRWEMSGARNIPAEIREQHLSVTEADFLEQYDKLCTEYNTAMGLDLGTDMDPPKDVLIEVRVLRDYGELVTETGVIQLTKNSTYYLKRTDAEHLIRQGILEHIVE